MKKDKTIQRQLDDGEKINPTDFDTMTYRILYETLHQAPPLSLPSNFAERVTTQVKPTVSSSHQTVGVTVTCILATLFTCGLAVYIVDATALLKLTGWIVRYKELLGFCAVMLTLIQITDHWLVRNTR